MSLRVQPRFVAGVLLAALVPLTALAADATTPTWSKPCATPCVRLEPELLARQSGDQAPWPVASTWQSLRPALEHLYAGPDPASLALYRYALGRQAEQAEGLLRGLEDIVTGRASWADHGQVRRDIVVVTRYLRAIVDLTDRLGSPASALPDLAEFTELEDDATRVLFRTAHLWQEASGVRSAVLEERSTTFGHRVEVVNTGRDTVSLGLVVPVSRIPAGDNDLATVRRVEAAPDRAETLVFPLEVGMVFDRERMYELYASVDGKAAFYYIEDKQGDVLRVVVR